MSEQSAAPDADFIRDGAFTLLVHTASHDDVKAGRLSTRLTHVRVSAEHFTPNQAVEVAACMAVAVHGGMPTDVHHVI